MAFICLLGNEIIAIGRYEGPPGDSGPGGTVGTADIDSAEVAFVIRDQHQGRGLGSILLEHLAAAARETGLRRFEAEVLVENHHGEFAIPARRVSPFSSSIRSAGDRPTARRPQRP